jgi:hypothetical protein
MTYSAIFALLGHRITYFLLMGVGGLIGSLFLYLDHVDRTIRTTFKATPCTIESSEVTMEEHVTRGRWNSRHVRRVYYADITYKYQIDGEEYENDVYRAFEQGMSEQEASAVAGRYYEGQSATCYVNPEDPEDAVLTLDSDRGFLYGVVVFALLFLFAGLAGWIVIDFVLPRADRTAKAPEEEFAVQVPEWSAPRRTS